MDKASASGAGDSRFESWAGHFGLHVLDKRSAQSLANGMLSNDAFVNDPNLKKQFFLKSPDAKGSNH